MTDAGARTAAVLVRRFLSEYGRNPVNLMLLVLVPSVFVLVVAPALAGAGPFTGGQGGPAVEAVSASWAAGFLAAVAMYFQVCGSRDADTRLVLCGMPRGVLTTARLCTGLVLAAGTAAVALLTLVLRTPVQSPARVAAGTLLGAVVFLSVGGLVGTVARDPVNGTVVVLFVWLLDTFFGPVMTSDRTVARILPTHFVQAWTVDLPTEHAGPADGLLLPLLVAALALTAVTVAFGRRLRTAQPRPAPEPGSTPAQRRAALRAVWRAGRRNPVQWSLFVVVPVVFILAADAVTADAPIRLVLRESGVGAQQVLRMPDVHGATMAPIAVAALAGLAGLFTVLDSRAGDRRAVVAGLRPSALLQARLALLVALTAVATAVSLAATAAVADPEQWVLYATATFLVGLTYGVVGALLAPVAGRVAGVFLVFLLPFLDLGVSQSPVLRPEPEPGAQLLPGYGGVRLLLDAALTTSFDEGRSIALAAGWVAALVVVLGLVYRRYLSTPNLQHYPPR